MNTIRICVANKLKTFWAEIKEPKLNAFHRQTRIRWGEHTDLLCDLNNNMNIHERTQRYCVRKRQTKRRKKNQAMLIFRDFFTCCCCCCCWSCFFFFVENLAHGCISTESAKKWDPFRTYLLHKTAILCSYSSELCWIYSKRMNVKCATVDTWYHNHILHSYLNFWLTKT